MSQNPDDDLEKIVFALLPLWGPFYAVFYLLRMMWMEIFKRNE